MCELPSEPNQVRDLGLSALEYQPGLFPEDAQAARPLLEGAGIRPAAGWIPVALAKADLPVTSTQRSRCPPGVSIHLPLT